MSLEVCIDICKMIQTFCFSKTCMTKKGVACYLWPIFIMHVYSATFKTKKPTSCISFAHNITSIPNVQHALLILQFFIATAILPIAINWRLIAKQTFYYFYITVSYKNWLCLPTPNQPAASSPTKPLLPYKFLLILFTNYEHLNVQTCLLPCLCLNYKS